MTNETSSVWQDLVPTYHYPPLPSERHLYGKHLIEDFEVVFGKKVWNTPHTDKLVLHVVSGQLQAMKKVRLNVLDTQLDLRIHGTVFQSSGSGKGRAFNGAAELCQYLDLNYQPITEITDAALIGSWEKNTIYIPKKGEKIVKTLLPGWLHPSQNIHIIAMNEAEVLFSTKVSPHAKNTMTYYQIAMNTMGTKDNELVKKLISGPEPVVCNPEFSLLLTSYLPENLLKVIVERGFLQRQINVINDVTSQDRLETALYSVHNLGKKPIGKYSLKEIGDRLLVVNQHIESNPHINISDDAINGMEVVVNDIFNPLDEVSIFPKKKLEEYVHRYLEHTYKIATHHMFFRLDNTMKSEDVAYAKNFIIPIWNKIVSYIEDSVQDNPKEHEKRITEYRIMKECYDALVAEKFTTGWVPLPTLSNLLQNQWDVSRPLTEKRIERAIEAGMFERKKKGLTKYVHFLKLPKK